LLQAAGHSDASMVLLLETQKPRSQVRPSSQSSVVEHR
jgi:hypothetical protein